MTEKKLRNTFTYQSLSVGIEERKLIGHIFKAFGIRDIAIIQFNKARALHHEQLILKSLAFPN